MTGLPPGVGSPSAARWLFSNHFLARRLPGWPDWKELDVRKLHAELQTLWASEGAALVGANEGQTEERLIRPVLRLLGHAYTLFPDLPGAGKTPDYLFYESDAEREAADAAGGQARVERALAVGDAKRFDLPLDCRSAEGDPVAQIRDYVLISRRPFGILTNGRVWRLYARDAGLVERACHEVDLVKLLEEGTVDDLRYFAAFFGASAFRLGVDGRSFLDRALADSALHAVEVSDALQQAIFAAVPAIAAGRTSRRRRADARGARHCLRERARLPLPAALLPVRRGPGTAPGRQSRLPALLRWSASPRSRSPDRRRAQPLDHE